MNLCYSCTGSCTCIYLLPITKNNDDTRKNTVPHYITSMKNLDLSQSPPFASPFLAMMWKAVLILICVIADDLSALDNGLAKTPPMGFNSYMAGPRCQNETGLGAVADFFVSSGLRDLGYVYINTDEGWEEKERDPDTGELLWNKIAYPSGLPTFIETLHDRNLKFGIYGAASGVTCGEGPGQLYHELKDAETYASWGVDFLKSDNCASYAIDSSVRFGAMAHALNRTGRRILLSIEPFSINPDPSQSIQVSNMWRIGCDIEGTYSAVMNRADLSDKWAPLAGPGGWNDPDLINLQNPGELGMTLGENRLYFGLWAIMKAPLLLSSNLMALEPAILDIIRNTEIISINQDPLGYQARKITIDGSHLPWKVGVEDCSTPVGLHLKHYRLGQQSDLRETRTWNAMEVGQDDLYQLMNEATGRCLSVLNDQVVLMPCLSSKNQHWLFDKGFSTVTAIRSAANGLNLAISNNTLYGSAHGHDSVNVSDSAYGQGGIELVTPYDHGECSIRNCQNYDPTQMWYYSSHDGLLRHALYTSSINHQPEEGEGYTLTNKIPTFRHHCLAHVLSDGNLGSDNGAIEVWGGKLSGGDYVLGLVNRGTNRVAITSYFASLLELEGNTQAGRNSTFLVRDLWKRNFLGRFTGSFEASISGHDIGIYRLSSQLLPINVKRS